MTQPTDFFTRLRQETEQKVRDYKDFEAAVEQSKNAMKLLAKTIEANNEMLTQKGLESVKFEK